VSVGTPFHPRTEPLNRTMAWGEWAGYAAAAVYADHHDIEYNAIRQAAALIDVTPLYKYIVSGDDAVRLVDRVITRDAGRLAVGQVCYTPWCDERGKVVDDGTVARLDETTFRWTAADPCFRWLRMNAGGLDVEIRDVTDEVAALALQGPRARAVLEQATGADWSDVRYFRRREATAAGVDVDVTRTGYTGDLGYELWVDAGRAVELWDALVAAGDDHGLRPAGIRAMDVARVEAGLILIEVEYTSARHAMTADHEYSPFELGLGRLVDFGKHDFVGRRALLREQEAGGPRRRLVGLELDWSGIEGAFARHGLPPAVQATVSRDPVPLFYAGGQVGRATSTCWSPALKKMIALGSIEAGLRPGAPLELEWSVEGERGRVGAVAVDLPFLDLERRRAP
jgi:glycine cleavage system T protein (aminomethyltransferase)